MALFALVETFSDDLSPWTRLSGFEFPGSASALHEPTRRTGLELDRVKRLLRLARAPKVIQDACHQGVLVDEIDERGTVKLLPPAIPSTSEAGSTSWPRSNSQKLHAHALKSSPKKADERSARAIQRALSERWSFRRVHPSVAPSVAAAEPEAAGVEAAAGATPLPSSVTVRSY